MLVSYTYKNIHVILHLRNRVLVKKLSHKFIHHLETQRNIQLRSSPVYVLEATSALDFKADGSYPPRFLALSSYSLLGNKTSIHTFPERYKHLQKWKQGENKTEIVWGTLCEDSLVPRLSGTQNIHAWRAWYIFSRDHDVIKIGPELLEQIANVLRVIQPALRLTLGVYDICSPIAIYV